MGACTSTVALQDAGADLASGPCDDAAACKQLQLTETTGAETAGAAFGHSPKRRGRRNSRSHASGVAPLDSDKYCAAAAAAAAGTAAAAAAGTAAALDAAICTAVAADQSAASTHPTRTLAAAEPFEPASATSDRRVPLSAVSTSCEGESGVVSLHSARQGRHSCNPSAQLQPLDEPAPPPLLQPSTLPTHSTKPPPPAPASAVAAVASSALPHVSTPAMAAWGVRGTDSRPPSAASRLPPAPVSRPSSARTKPFGRGAAGVADVEDNSGFSMQEPHSVVAAELPPLVPSTSVPAAAAAGVPAPPTTDCLKLVRRMNFAKLPPLKSQQQAELQVAAAVSGGRTARSAVLPLSSAPAHAALASCHKASPSPPLVGCSVFVDASCQEIPSTRSSRSARARGATMPLVVSIDCRTPPDGQPVDQHQSQAPAMPALKPSHTAVEAQMVASASFADANDDSVEEVKLVRRVRGGAKWRKKVEQVKQKQLEDELAVVAVAVQQQVCATEHKEEALPVPCVHATNARVGTAPVVASALSSAPDSSVQIVAPQPLRPAVLVLQPPRAVHAGAAAPQRPGTPNPSVAVFNSAPPAPSQQPKPAKASVTPRGLPPRPEPQRLPQREHRPARTAPAHLLPPAVHSLSQWVVQPFLAHQPRTAPCPFPARPPSPPGRSLLDFQEERARINREHAAGMGARTHSVLELLRAGMLSPRVSARLVRAGSLQPLHTGRAAPVAREHALPYVFDPSGDSMPQFDLASDREAGRAQAQPQPQAASRTAAVQTPSQPQAAEVRLARPPSAIQKLKMEQRAAGAVAPPVLRKLPLRPTIPPLNLELLGLPRSSGSGRPETRRAAVPPSPQGRLFPLTPRDGSAAAGGEDEFEPGSQRLSSGPSPSHSPQADDAAPSHHTLDGALNTSRRPASGRSAPGAQVALKKTAPVLPRTLPAPALQSAPKPVAAAVAAAAVQVSAGVAPTMARAPAPGHYVQDLSKDTASIRAFCSRLSAAAAQGQGGIAHLTLYQSAPAATPMSLVEHHVWRILDAIIAGAAARAPVAGPGSGPGAGAGAGAGRVLDVLDMTDVTGEGMVRSIMRRMCQADSEVEAEQKQQQRPQVRPGQSQSQSQNHAQPSNGGLLRLKQLMLRLDFPSMCEARFSNARNIYSLCLRALSSTSLTRLNLYRSNLGEKGVSTVIAAAARNPNLRTLELVACGVGPLGGQLLVLLAEHPSLTAVDLSLNCMGDAEVVTACSALANPRSRLQSLGLALNEFGIEGVRALCQTLRSRACGGAGRPSGLRALNIEGTNLAGLAGAAEVAQMLSSPGCALERLNVSYCNLGVEGVRVVCHAVARSPHLQLRELNIAGNMGPDLSRAAINSSAAAVAAAQIGAMRSLELLAHNQTLRALDLRDNHLLARPCAVLQSLQSLAAAHPALETLLLSGNGLTREQTAALQAQLASNKERRLQQQRHPIVGPVQPKPASLGQAIHVLAPQAPVRPPSASSHSKASVTPLNLAAGLVQPRAAPVRQPLASVPLQQPQQQTKQNALTVAAAKLTARASARTTLVSNLGAPRISARMPVAPAQPLPQTAQQRSRHHPPGGMQVFYAALDGGKTAPAGGRPISARPIRSSAALSGDALFGAGNVSSVPRSFESPAPKMTSARGDLTLFGVGPPQANPRVPQLSSSYLVDPNHISVRYVAPRS